MGRKNVSAWWFCLVALPEAVGCVTLPPQRDRDASTPDASNAALPCGVCTASSQCPNSFACFVGSDLQLTTVEGEGRCLRVGPIGPGFPTSNMATPIEGGAKTEVRIPQAGMTCNEFRRFFQEVTRCEDAGLCGSSASHGRCINTNDGVPTFCSEGCSGGLCTAACTPGMNHCPSGFLCQTGSIAAGESFCVREQ